MAGGGRAKKVQACLSCLCSEEMSVAVALVVHVCIGGAGGRGGRLGKNKVVHSMEGLRYHKRI